MLRILNTLTGSKEEFTPRDPSQVRMYVCGITPYDESHIGHGMSYVVFDVIRRYLEYRGYGVRHVQNFTDIDDKIIDRAQRLNITAEELAEGFIQRYFDDMGLLGIQRAHEYPRATREIPAIIRMVEGLIEKGYAYASDGDVYYRVAKFEGYGKLSHRTLDGMMAGARVAVSESKEEPTDFALWKSAKPGEPAWDSPWGRGRPGWHIECSAMSLSYLGESLDIHGGGADLIFPHHENEIAQSEAFTDVAPFTRYWVHHGLLRLGEEKMSKSLGNLISIRDAVGLHGADAFRTFVLTSHYRNPLTWSEEGLAASARAVKRLTRAARGDVSGSGPALDPASYQERFITAMDDDFNTPQALATLFDLARDLNRAAEEGQDVSPARALLRELGVVLGLTFQDDSATDQQDVAPFIELLIQTREDLRKERQFAMADQIRDRLTALGVTLEDTPRGTEWRLQTSEGAAAEEDA